MKFLDIKISQILRNDDHIRIIGTLNEGETTDIEETTRQGKSTRTEVTRKIVRRFDITLPKTVTLLQVKQKAATMLAEYNSSLRLNDRYKDTEIFGL